MLTNADAVLLNLFGKTFFNGSNSVVDFQNGVVGIGADIKNARDTDVAVRSNTRVVVKKSLNARELIFDGGCDRTG